MKRTIQPLLLGALAFAFPLVSVHAAAAAKPTRWSDRATWPGKKLPVAGDKVVARIRREPDATIRGIVAGWPRNFDASRAESLGFSSEKSFEAIIRVHIEDELGGTFVA